MKTEQILGFDRSKRSDWRSCWETGMTEYDYFSCIVTNVHSLFSLIPARTTDLVQLFRIKIRKAPGQPVDKYKTWSNIWLLHEQDKQQRLNRVPVSFMVPVIYFLLPLNSCLKMCVIRTASKERSYNTKVKFRMMQSLSNTIWRIERREWKWSGLFTAVVVLEWKPNLNSNLVHRNGS